MALPVPFQAVHLLFINLLTDSLPAIALGLEPHNDRVMHDKPRPRARASSQALPPQRGAGGVGHPQRLPSSPSTWASTTAARRQGPPWPSPPLCLSRLFHGFNCKAAEPVIFTRKFWNNKPLLAAFAVGTLLLVAVLAIPVLEELMQAVALPWTLGLAIPGLAIGSMLVIQLLKAIRTGFGRKP